MHPVPQPPDNLPARRDATFGGRNTPLIEAPTAALAFALGYACARPQQANSFGPFCAVVEELRGRRATVPPANSYTSATAFEAILAELPDEMARAIQVLYSMNRGQRWAATGQPGARGAGPDTGAHA